MLLFLDTEYTGFGQLPPKLISLAIVAEDGKREFYAELSDTWQHDDCTEFVKQQVLPLLSGPGTPLVEVRSTLRTWFADGPRFAKVACDSGTDWKFLLDLLGTPRPENLADQYYDLRPLVDTAVYHSAVDAYFRLDAREHHALTDARAYRCAWLAWMDSRKTLMR